MYKFDYDGWNRGVARAKGMLDGLIPGDEGDQLSRFRQQIAEACSGPETSESLAFTHALTMMAWKGRG